MNALHRLGTGACTLLPTVLQAPQKSSLLQHGSKKARGGGSGGAGRGPDTSLAARQSTLQAGSLPITSFFSRKQQQ